MIPLILVIVITLYASEWEMIAAIAVKLSGAIYTMSNTGRGSCMRDYFETDPMVQAITKA